MGLAVHHLDDHLAEPLACTHDVGRVHGLVGADEHESADTIVRRCPRHLIGAHDVVLDGLVRAVLHEGDVLMRCSMENDFGLVRGDDGVDATGVSNGADERDEIERGVVPTQLLLDVVGVVLVDIEDDELFGLVSRNLTAELGTDGSATTSDENSLAPD